MRPIVLTACLVVAACGGAPRSTPEVMPEVAAEFVAVYNDWDEPRFAALFATRRAVKLQEHFTWLHTQLGACGEPRFMFSTSDRGARFTHACERGALETWFKLDAAGKIVEMSSGAADLPPPPEIQAAASAVIASLPWSALPVRPFQSNLAEDWPRRLGTCTLVRPWVFGEHNGLFHLRCEGGEAAVLGVRLHPDGTLARANMLRAELYTYKDPPG